MLTPLPPNQWDPSKAAHLLNRAGFGGTPAHIDSLVQSGMAASVRYLVDGPAAPAPVAVPDWGTPQARDTEVEQLRTELTAVPVGDPESMKRARGEIVRGHRRMQEQRTIELGAWWLDRMRQSVDPLAEKMTLFWHGHFATSAQKVKNAYFFLGQNQTFREQARGNFGVLVKAMSRDPAMIDWLDLKQSRAAHPNENFAREVMELFTLGEGNYTEQDVTEGAKAFTGYRIDPRTGTFAFNFREHDNTPKTFLGRTDVRDGDQAIDTILAQPACSRYLARKLWTFFAYENPSAPLVEALAETLRASHYEMRPVLHRMFTSQEFYSPLAIRTQIKSPVQWMVETARTLEVELPAQGPLLYALRQMGQIPFYPPSVKGWDGGKAWISTSTLLTRYNVAGALLNIAPKPLPALAAPADNADSMMLTEEGEPVATPPPAPVIAPRQVDLNKLAPSEQRGDPVALVRTLAMRLFQGTPSAKDEEKFVAYLRAAGPHVNDGIVAGLMHLMMSTPSFQLC